MELLKDFEGFKTGGGGVSEQELLDYLALKSDKYIHNDDSTLAEVKVGDDLGGTKLQFDLDEYIGYPDSSLRITFQNGAYIAFTINGTSWVFSIYNMPSSPMGIGDVKPTPWVNNGTYYYMLTGTNGEVTIPEGFNYIISDIQGDLAANNAFTSVKVITGEPKTETVETNYKAIQKLKKEVGELEIPEKLIINDSDLEPCSGELDQIYPNVPVGQQVYYSYFNYLFIKGKDVWRKLITENTIECTLCSAPSLITFSNEHKLGFHVDWSAAKGATSYRLTVNPYMGSNIIDVNISEEDRKNGYDVILPDDNSYSFVVRIYPDCDSSLFISQYFYRPN